MNDSGDQYVDVHQIDDLIFLPRRVSPFVSFPFYLSFKEICKTQKIFVSAVDHKGILFFFVWMGLGLCVQWGFPAFHFLHYII